MKEEQNMHIEKGRRELNPKAESNEKAGVWDHHLFAATAKLKALVLAVVCCVNF